MACSDGAVQVSKPGIGVELAALCWVAGTVGPGLALGAGEGLCVAVSVGTGSVGVISEGRVSGVTAFEDAVEGAVGDGTACEGTAWEGSVLAGAGDVLAGIGCDCGRGYQAAGVHARLPRYRSRARRYQLAGYQRSALRSHARSQGVSVTRRLARLLGARALSDDRALLGAAAGTTGG